MVSGDASRSAGYFTIPHDHPALPGHFPGRPVVPGVVLIDRALALLLEVLPGFAPVALSHGKFFAPVLPGERIDVHYRPHGGGGFALVCLRNGEIVASFTLDAAAP